VTCVSLNAEFRKNVSKLQVMCCLHEAIDRRNDRLV